jgi:hypothetical protein
MSDRERVSDDRLRYRVGRKLGTTIYLGDEEQPRAWVPNDPPLASHIVAVLNDESDARDRIARAVAALEAVPWLQGSGPAFVAVCDVRDILTGDEA